MFTNDVTNKLYTLYSYNVVTIVKIKLKKQ